MSLVGKLFILDDVLKDSFCNDYVSGNVEILPNICYDPENANVAVGDIYRLKEREGKQRVLINIHGGGWIVGDKKWRKGFAEIFANAGVSVFNINYGLSPDYTYPFCIQNAFSALKWVYDNAEEYGFDTDNIFMCGDSAGAQISCMVGALQENKAEREYLKIDESEARVNGVLLFSGAYDVEALFRLHPLTYKMAKDMRGGVSKTENFENEKYLSPLNFVDKTFPKSFVVGARLDVICFRQDVLLIKKLKELALEYSYFRSRSLFSSDHCFHLRYRHKDSRKCLRQAIDFVLEVESGEEMIDTKPQ